MSPSPVPLSAAAAAASFDATSRHVKTEMKRLLEDGYLAVDDQVADFDGGFELSGPRLTTRASQLSPHNLEERMQRPHHQETQTSSTPTVSRRATLINTPPSSGVLQPPREPEERSTGRITLGRESALRWRLQVASV